MTEILDLLQLMYDFIYQLFITILEYFPIGGAMIPFGSSTYELSVIIASLMSVFITIVFVLFPFYIIWYIIKLLKGRVRS